MNRKSIEIEWCWSVFYSNPFVRTANEIVELLDDLEMQYWDEIYIVEEDYFNALDNLNTQS